MIKIFRTHLLAFPRTGNGTRVGDGSKLQSGLPTLKRFGPLACVAAATLLALASGWHREVTLENIVVLRDRFDHVLAALPATFAFASAGAGLDSVLTAAKAEYAECVLQTGPSACKLAIHANSLVTTELALALGLDALIPVAVRQWRVVHAAAK